LVFIRKFGEYCFLICTASRRTIKKLLQNFPDIKFVKEKIVKKNLIPAIVIFLILAFLAGLVVLVFYHPQRAANQDFANVSPIRGVRLDYINVSTSRSEVAGLETQMQQSGVNLVALSAGRVDWSYFIWRSHSDRWSADVKATGVDFLMEDSTRFSKWAHVSAVVDVLAPLYIQDHPEAASVSWLGVPSKNMVSTMELVDGVFGQNLLAMVAEIATYYPVNSITLTELVYYTDGFGETDKAAYSAYSGHTDWPRSADGKINIDDQSIGEWRSYELGRFIKKAAMIVHQHDKLLFVEARLAVDGSNEVVIMNGTNFNQILNYADRLVVWGNRDIDGHSQSAVKTAAQFIAPYGHRILLMVGLWDKNYPYGIPNAQMSSIPAADFQSALLAADQGGAKDVLVTPSFLIGHAQWLVLKGFWSGE
jgi:hypothetical protein